MSCSRLNAIAIDNIHLHLHDKICVYKLTKFFVDRSDIRAFFIKRSNSCKTADIIQAIDQTCGVCNFIQLINVVLFNNASVNVALVWGTCTL